MVSGKAPQNTRDVFRSQAELVAAMSDKDMIMTLLIGKTLSKTRQIRFKLLNMAKKKSGSGTSDTRHPYHEYIPEKKEYYRQLELPIKLAKMKKRTNNNVNEV